MSEVLTEERTEELTGELEEALACEQRGHSDELRQAHEAFSLDNSCDGVEEELLGELDSGPEDAIPDPEGEGEPRDDAREDAGSSNAGGARECWPYGDSVVQESERPSSRDITTKELGMRGEDAAANYLVRKGYRILERNWTCRFGEADIIAVDDQNTVVFVEVKTRRTSDCGLPEEAITKEKQRRYEKIALTYLMEANWNDDVDFRFDAIGIYVTGDYKAMLKHHLGCFNGF